MIKRTKSSTSEEEDGLLFLWVLLKPGFLLGLVEIPHIRIGHRRLVKARTGAEMWVSLGGDGSCREDEVKGRAVEVILVN